MADKKLPSIDIPIQFEFDSAKITFDAYKQVEALANALKNPKLAKTRVSVNGYTDAKGTDQHNHVLSEERAASVQEALINEFGIAPDRLVAVGFGEEGLKAPDDPEGAVNRRVEVVSIGEL
ncbi:OmpA family protein [Ensifer aridi]|uniref:OmpA family protein n=1 Tax=Ensifer aridi TaxID=1708715 RepID=UPI0015E44030|nr:OmpA family protein [Ensifer aridi]